MDVGVLERGRTADDLRVETALREERTELLLGDVVDDVEHVAEELDRRLGERLLDDLRHVERIGDLYLPDRPHDLGTELVIEFPTRDDPRVAALLMRKKDGAHPDYDREPFERALAERFEVERTEELAGGTRILYYAKPR